MPGLFHILSVGSESLQNSRQGVDTTGHNIANAQVEGYSRQRVNVKQRDPLARNDYQIGNGALVTGITRSHDKFIEAQLTKAKQDTGHAEALHDGWKSIELIFSPELNATVPDQVAGFFGALEDLSSAPDDPSVRTSVLEKAQDLGVAFRRVDSDLKRQRAGIEEKISITTTSISDTLKGIANLNLKIQVSEAGNPESACDLRDQRDKMVRELSSQINLHYYEDKNGMLFIRGPGEVTLVDGVHASAVDLAPGKPGSSTSDIVVVDWESKRTRPITEKLESGALRGLLDLRDVEVPRLIEKNNEMAYSLASHFNAIHRTGFGLRNYAETQGRNFFKEPTSLDNAALEFDIDPAVFDNIDAISAASTPLAAGDNVVLNQLIKLKDAKITENNSMNLNELYASSAGATGLRVIRAAHFEEISKTISQDLTRRREAVSGVSLDEEATNMLKWQANFTASSKLITTCDEMIETVLGLKR